MVRVSFPLPDSTVFLRRRGSALHVASAIHSNTGLSQAGMSWWARTYTAAHTTHTAMAFLSSATHEPFPSCSSPPAQFYCEVCDKQYTTARQLEEHLSSYDHHHRKRLAETKAAMAERNREDRQRREQRAADKEMARLQKQIEAAQQRSRQQGQAAGVPAVAAVAVPPLPEEPPPLPPLPGDVPPLPPGPPPVGEQGPGTAAAGAGGVVLGAGGTGISFGLGAGAGAGRGRGGAVRGGMAMGGLKRPAGAPMGAAGRGVKGPAAGSGPGRPAAVAGFGLDSDDEEGS